MPVTYAQIRQLARELPEVEESTSYGTPALKVRGKLIVRLKEDGQSIVLRTTFEDREFLLRSAPDVFFFTPHYHDFPWVLVRLATITRPQLRVVLRDAWRLVAPKKSAGSGKGPRAGPSRPSNQR